MNNTINEFHSLMTFTPSLQGYISCEREFFLMDVDNTLVPKAKEFLDHMNDPEHFSYELSACQVEYKTGPQKDPRNLKNKIRLLEKQCAPIEQLLGVRRGLIEVAPDTMPMDIYPDDRYQSMAASKSYTQLLKMLQVTACQFHVGMPDYETALRVYNKLIPFLPGLESLCDHSNGKRLQLYRAAAPNHQPLPIKSLEDHYAQALKFGYDQDLKNCHSLIRITRFGTIEFRMFGAATNEQEVIKLARHVQNLCLDLMD